MATASTGRTIARNSLVSSAGLLILKVISFFYTVSVVRMLGSEPYGQYMTAMAFVEITAIFSALGIGQYGLREIAKDHNKAPGLFADMVGIRLVLSLIVVVTNTALAWLLGYSTEIILYILLLSCTLILYAFKGPLEDVLQGFERIDISSSLMVLHHLVAIGVGLALLVLGWGVTGVIIGTASGLIVSGVVAFRFARSLTPLSFRITPARWLPLVRAGFPFAIILFATGLSFKVDTILLSLWQSNTEVAWYSVAYAVIFTLLLVPTALNNSVIPTLSRQFGSDPAGVERFYQHGLRLIWVAVIPITVGVTLLGPRIISLIYGAEFRPAGIVLQVLIWSFPAVSLTLFCAAMTQVLHREYGAARINTVNAGFNIALNLWVIPRYGIMGAAVTTVATEVLGLIQYSLLLRGTTRLKALAMLLWAPLPAVLAMAAALILLYSLPIIALIPLGAIVYAGMLIVTRAVRFDELRALFEAVDGVVRRRTRIA